MASAACASTALLGVVLGASPAWADEDPLAFGVEVVAALTRQDRDALLAMFDTQALIERAVGALELPSATLDDITATAEEFPATGVASLLGKARAGDCFAAPRVLSPLPQARLLIRRISTEGGFDFMELEVRRTEDAWRIVDVRYWYVGSWWSVLLREAAEVKQRTQVRTGWGRPTPEPDGADVLEKMARLQEAGEYAEAVAAFEELPAWRKSTRKALVARLDAARECDRDEYQSALDALLAEFPDDAFGAVRGVDVALRWGDAEDVLGALDALEPYAPRDAYLSVLRANHLVELQQVEAAERAITLALSLEPDLFEAARAAINVHLSAVDPEAVYQDLLRLEQAHSWISHVPVDDPLWAPFLGTPLHHRWLRAHHRLPLGPPQDRTPLLAARRRHQTRLVGDPVRWSAPPLEPPQNIFHLI